jgi:hypothetical protein
MDQVKALARSVARACYVRGTSTSLPVLAAGARYESLVEFGCQLGIVSIELIVVPFGDLHIAVVVWGHTSAYELNIKSCVYAVHNISVIRTMVHARGYDMEKAKVQVQEG